MNIAVGGRVVAICDSDDTQVRIFGRGVYAGRFQPPYVKGHLEAMRASARAAVLEADANPIDPAPMFDALVEDATMTREEADAALSEGRRRQAEHVARPVEERVDEVLAGAALNPRIDLDGGATVWGYQCWWLDEGRFDTELVAGRVVVEVPPPDPG